VAALERALAERAPLYELMVNFAAYNGLRWGELVALTAGQISETGRLVRWGG
jgi:integrase